MTEDSTVTDVPLLIAFQPYRIFSKRFLRYVAIIIFSLLLGLFSTADSTHLHNPHFITFMSVYLTTFLAIFVGRRILLQRRGGVPPLRFEAASIMLPAHMHSSRIYTLAYEDVLSVTVRGKRRAVLIIDTKKRQFVYPVKELADPQAMEKIEARLRERVTLLAGGRAQLDAMQSRRETGAKLSTVPPFVTWATTGLLILIFCLQLWWESNDNMLSSIDMGANASLLTLNGQWYRLVTANLLHGGIMHIFNNLIFLLILGAMAERLLGAKRFLLLMLATGILSQITSAVWNGVLSTRFALYSVGVSGVLFGILGALAVLNRRFKGQFPGGFRLTARFWWIMLGLNLVIVPMATPNIDSSAHIGGLLSGLLVGWLLCRSQTALAEPPRTGPAFLLSLFTLSVVWIWSTGFAVLHAVNPELRQGDHAALAHAELSAPVSNAEADNELAWDIATSASPSPERLEDARALAERSVEGTKHDARVRRRELNASKDTLATVYYRMNRLDDALSEETSIMHSNPDSTIASQLARFLNAYIKTQPTRMIGSLADMPEIRLVAPDGIPEHWSFNFTRPEEFLLGSQLFLLLRQNDKLLGMIVIALPLNKGPTAYSGWFLPKGTTLPAFDPKGPAPTLTLAQVDAISCHCAPGESPGAQFYEYEEDIAKLP